MLEKFTRIVMSAGSSPEFPMDFIDPRKSRTVPTISLTKELQILEVPLQDDYYVVLPKIHYYPDDENKERFMEICAARLIEEDMARGTQKDKEDRYVCCVWDDGFALAILGE